MHKHGERFNIADFGAVGDGVTDDTQAILDAVAASQQFQHGPGIVWFPRGTFAVSAAPGGAALLFQGEDGIVLEGHSGSDSVIKFIAPDMQASLVAFIDGTNAEVRNLGFDGNSTSYAEDQTLLDFRGTENIRVTGCDFTNFGDVGLRASILGGAQTPGVPEGTLQARELRISDNRFERFFGRAIDTYESGFDRMIINGNYITEGRLTGIRLLAGSDENTLDDSSTKVAITGNIIFRIGTVPAIGLDSGTETVDGILLEDNLAAASITGNVIDDIRLRVDANSNGIRLVPRTRPGVFPGLQRHITISGNTINGREPVPDYSTTNEFWGNGISIETAAGDALSNVAITGNQVASFYNGFTVFGTSGDARVQGITVTGNRFNVDHVGIWCAPFLLQHFNFSGNNIRAQVRGMVIRGRGGNITGNYIYDTVFGIELRTATVGGVSTGDIDVNSNTIFASAQDVITNSQESYLQIGERYIWTDATGDVRVGITDRPTGLNTGTVVGTQV